MTGLNLIMSIKQKERFYRYTTVKRSFICTSHNAENRNRTGTVVTYRRILSPVRLPVPPPRHINP